MVIVLMNDIVRMSRWMRGASFRDTQPNAELRRVREEGFGAVIRRNRLR